MVKKVKHGGVCAHICIAGTRERELAEPWASLTAILALSVNSRPVRDHVSKERQRKM